jgi:C1A family cysteine protease
MLIYF